MSLPWNRSVQLQVGPRAVVGSLHAGWPRVRALARTVQAFAADDTDANRPVTVCSEAMDAVLTELQAMPAGQGRQLRVLLADARVHFDVVSGDYRKASEKQLQSIATACVDEVLGHRASPQTVRWQLQPGMRHLLIAAMDAGDVEAAAQVAAQHRLRLRSLQPVFCARWNQHAASLPGGTGVFAVVDGGHVVVAFVRNGGIAALSSGRCVAELLPTGHEGGRKSDLDERTDRLLASLGQGTDSVPAFVRVVSGPDAAAVAPRWTVIQHEEGAV